MTADARLLKAAQIIGQDTHPQHQQLIDLLDCAIALDPRTHGVEGVGGKADHAEQPSPSTPPYRRHLTVVVP